MSAVERLAALETAVRDGAPVDAVELAAAQTAAKAEVDLADLRAAGERDRATAAVELAAAQAAALDAVRADLPVEPTEALDALQATAMDAMDALHAGIRTYAGRVETVRGELRAAGVVEKAWGEQPGFDHANHGLDIVGVVIDGTVYAANYGRVKAVVKHWQKVCP